MDLPRCSPSFSGLPSTNDQRMQDAGRMCAIATRRYSTVHEMGRHDSHRRGHIDRVPTVRIEKRLASFFPSSQHLCRLPPSNPGFMLEKGATKGVPVEQPYHHSLPPPHGTFVDCWQGSRLLRVCARTAVGWRLVGACTGCCTTMRPASPHLIV